MIKNGTHNQLLCQAKKPKNKAHRGELGGILAGIVFANKVCKNYNITEGKCTMGCDN
jgi:hypothetical protein